MPLRALIINDELRQAVADVMAFAMRPENLYVPGEGVVPPGDRKEMVIRTGGYRIVFSITWDKENKIKWKHLSMSVPGDKFPHPAAIAEVATLFGFDLRYGTDGMLKKGDQVLIDANQEEGFVAVAEVWSGGVRS